MSSSNLPPFIPNTTGFTYTEPPQPEWTYRQGIEATADGRAWIEGEKAGWKTIDTATEDPRFYVHFIDLEKYLMIGNIIANCTPPLYQALFLVQLLLSLRYRKMGLRISLRSGDDFFLIERGIYSHSLSIKFLFFVIDCSFFNQVWLKNNPRNKMI